MAGSPMRKGWFKIPGVQDGDRTIDQQLKGLGRLLDEVRGKTVLDLGCAEGLVALALLQSGARKVYGVEVVHEAVAAARKIAGPQLLDVVQHDLNDPTTERLVRDASAEVVLLLAILHKLRDPLRLVRDVAASRPELVVMRTPATTPGYVQDVRSGMRRFDVAIQLCMHGYTLEHVDRGHFEEWVGYFRRNP